MGMFYFLTLVSLQLCRQSEVTGAMSLVVHRCCLEKGEHSRKSPAVVSGLHEV